MASDASTRIWIDGQSQLGAVNVGVRPQFHDNAPKPLVEAYIMDFDRDIYDQDVRLEFVDRLVYELYGLTEEEIGIVEGG